jgi:hypothetical protein
VIIAGSCDNQRAAVRHHVDEWCDEHVTQHRVPSDLQDSVFTYVDVVGSANVNG